MLERLSQIAYRAIQSSPKWRQAPVEVTMLTRNALIREYQARGNLPGLLVFYALLVGTMAWTASAII